MFARLLMTVTALPLSMSPAYRSLLGEMPRITTVAPMPVATVAALNPATPPPMITTFTGGTPETPEINTPMPPEIFSRP